MPKKTDPLIVKPVSEIEGNGNWLPLVGSETISFLDTVVPAASRDNILGAASSILSKGVSPTTGSGKETGLVIGYVQSGKTMSFETCAALARDNGFQIVILIVGISLLLLEQSTSRLSHDLGIQDQTRARRWVLFKNPANDSTTIQTIRDILEDWSDSNIPDEFNKTILITVSKNYIHLENLSSLFKALNMEGKPVLIIDDEADQASLNIEVTQGEESTIFERLGQLREALPLHTYLQYTATPQAPLLLSIIDSLSPNFVQVLKPGEDYIGGKEFFSDDLRLVKLIPNHEVPTNNNQLNGPPESLLNALRIFIVGITIEISKGDTGNRSMLVHPSHRTTHHLEFYEWVRDIMEEWKRINNLPNQDPDKLELIEDFREAYSDLKETVEDVLPNFDKISPLFSLALRNTRTLEMNARLGSTPNVDWRSAYAWILVGGQAMDRGFTIEGLTVTYMPRGIGVGNADTVQQRARFFGYKKKYIGFCRIYLEQGTLDAYQNYVEHEQDIRKQLEDIQTKSLPLNEWKRAFVLDPSLRPCRKAVLEFDYIRGNFSNRWFEPRVVNAPENIIEDNRVLIKKIIQQFQFSEDVGHPERTEAQKHQVCHEVSLSQVLEQLLLIFRITGTTDSQRYLGLLLQLSTALENNPKETCTIYKISPTISRRRSVDEHGVIPTLFQGEFPVEKKRRGEIYPGDRAIHERDEVTIQIHMLDLIHKTTIVKENVPVIAVWIPDRLTMNWIAQDQPTLR